MFAGKKGAVLVFLWFFVNACQGDEAHTLLFPHSCTKSQSIEIVAVGDVLLHRPLQVQAASQGFTGLWSAALPFIKAADIAYANLEGPIAADVNQHGREIKRLDAQWDMTIYSSFPAFNYHPSLAMALKQSGFTIVSTANNHALDRFAIGIDKTLRILDEVGVAHVGTRMKGSNAPWEKTIVRRGITTAWLACTETTNGISDHFHQVLHCDSPKDRRLIMDTVRKLKGQVDAVIVLPHWGEEYHAHPSGWQIQFAHEVLDAGALIVIGSHPHVIQPMQKYITQEGRTALVLYSLGNFVSYQGRPMTRTTAIFVIGLTKTPQGTFINGVRFVPMSMHNREGLYHIRLLPIEKNKKTLEEQVLFHVLPMGNALYTLPLVTNPECGPP